MSKKSRKRAAKYSELSKSRPRRRRQLDKVSAEPKAVMSAETKEVEETKETQVAAAKSPEKRLTPKVSPKAQPERKTALPGYQYVREDLKRIGILSAAVVVILVILAFVLG